jgi:hypothetical protein
VAVFFSSGVIQGEVHDDGIILINLNGHRDVLSQCEARWRDAGASALSACALSSKRDVMRVPSDRGYAFWHWRDS